MPTPSTDPYAALRYVDFRLMTGNQLFMSLATLMQAVSVSFMLYTITHDPLVLGFMGLAEALPFIALSLWGGYVADKYNRQRIAQWCVLAMLPLPLVYMALFYGFFTGWFGTKISEFTLLLGCYSVICAQGFIGGFYSPASRSLKPFLIPPEHYANGATWNTAVQQVGTISGPVLAGLSVGFFGIIPTLTWVFMLFCLCGLVIWRLSPREFAPLANQGAIWDVMREGFAFIWHTPIILWAISLDLISVLFGGVVALLPIFATDVLHLGAEGLGVLRAAPSVGALLMMGILTHFPPTRHAWRNMLLSVAGFGVFTLVFAWSEWLWLSVIALALTGAFDSVSVVIRQTILQVFPPEHLRGRVQAVNGMFVSSSNELGAFESGLAARLLGTIPAVALGGAMTLATVGISAMRTRNLLGVELPRKK